MYMGNEWVWETTENGNYPEQSQKCFGLGQYLLTKRIYARVAHTELKSISAGSVTSSSKPIYSLTADNRKFEPKWL